MSCEPQGDLLVEAGLTGKKLLLEAIEKMSVM